MRIVAFLPVLVLAMGLVAYFVCAGLSKATVAEVSRICILCGLLAFLMGAGSQSCSMSAAGGSSGAAHH